MVATERTPIRVVGRYALYNEIAAGGMATIHLGRLLGPVGFARTVAVKRLHPQFAKDPEFVSMFLDEARLAARVQHPNVVATIDVVATGGELFLIMDYVRGESLSKILRTIRKQGKLVPPRIAAAIMCGFLHGLHAAHEAKNERGEPLNLVHRDVSPQNVLVGSDGIARVLDFGIAKAQGRIQVTRDGQIKGKLAYMPPEQLAGRPLSRAVDIYASAVVMWETLTTERLFKGETEGETLSKILRDSVPAPSELEPTLPKKFDAPILKSLDRDPSKRHSTAKELALELERCCGIASPTEVGEWVEEVVGHVLDAREEQIAEIESSTVGMNVSQSDRPSTDGESDSDMSFPSSHAIRAAVLGSPVDTLPMGSGPPQAGDRLRPTQPRVPHLQRTGPFPIASPSSLQRIASSDTSNPSMMRTDETTDRRSREATAMLTGTMSMLPVDRKLPLIATVGGVAVLLVVLAIVIGGKYSSSANAKSHADDSTHAPALSASTASPEPVPVAKSAKAPTVAQNDDNETTTDGTSLDDDEPTDPPEDSPPQPTAPSSATAPVRPVATPSNTTKITVTTPKPTATPKKNCDPPYTIDATGRRKYKLECM